MKGLLYKEYCLTAFQAKTWLFLLLFFIIFCVCTGDTGPFTAGICAAAIANTFSVFSIEKRSKSDRGSAVYPVTRREIVAARYISLLCFDLCGALLCGASALALGESIPETAASLMAVLAVSILMQVFLLPAIYRFGEAKARIFLIALVAAAMFVFVRVLAVPFSGLTEEETWKFLALGLILSAALIYPSWLLSARSMEKRDL